MALNDALNYALDFSRMMEFMDGSKENESIFNNICKIIGFKHSYKTFFSDKNEQIHKNTVKKFNALLKSVSKKSVGRKSVSKKSVGRKSVGRKSVSRKSKSRKSVGRNILNNTEKEILKSINNYFFFILRDIIGKLFIPEMKENNNISKQTLSKQMEPGIRNFFLRHLKNNQSPKMRKSNTSKIILQKYIKNCKKMQKSSVFKALNIMIGHEGCMSVSSRSSSRSGGRSRSRSGGRSGSRSSSRSGGRSGSRSGGRSRSRSGGRSRSKSVNQSGGDLSLILCISIIFLFICGMWFYYALDSNNEMQNKFSRNMQSIISTNFVSDGSAEGDQYDVNAMSIYNNHAREIAWLDLHWIQRFIYRKLRENTRNLKHWLEN